MAEGVPVQNVEDVDRQVQQFLDGVRSRTEEGKVCHFVGRSVLGSQSLAGREAQRSENITVGNYCVVRGDVTSGSPPWWVGLIVDVTVLEGVVQNLVVHECGDENHRGSQAVATAAHARIFRKITREAKYSSSGVLTLEKKKIKFLDHDQVSCKLDQT